MQELSNFEINMISGAGMTENQCIGMVTLGGGIVGGLATGISTGGLGTAGGWGLGMALGGAVGMMICRYRVNPV